MPEVGGGPSTSIFVAGSDLLTSFQVVYGFGDQRARVRRIRDVLGQRQVHILARQGQRLCPPCSAAMHDAVVTHLDLDDFLDAVLRAGLQFSRR